MAIAFKMHVRDKCLFCAKEVQFFMLMTNYYMHELFQLNNTAFLSRVVIIITVFLQALGSLRIGKQCQLLRENIKSCRKLDLAWSMQIAKNLQSPKGPNLLFKVKILHQINFAFAQISITVYDTYYKQFIVSVQDQDKKIQCLYI